MGTLLFDDIPYLRRAQEEHDEFAALLRSQGVEVLYLDELMAETLKRLYTEPAPGTEAKAENAPAAEAQASEAAQAEPAAPAETKPENAGEAAHRRRSRK